MSLQLDFEPHSWYMNFAIRKTPQMMVGGILNHWEAFTDDGNTYQIDDEEAETLEQLKFQIREYYILKSKGDMNHVPARLIGPLSLHFTRTRIPY